jgi:hypothetical protein
LSCRNSNNLVLKNYYKKYCKILPAVIKEAKNLETNKTGNSAKTIILSTEWTSVSNHQVLANQFYKYFISIAKSIKNHNDSKFTYIQYSLQSFKTDFQNINLKFISIKEVENIIKSFKTKNSAGYDEISAKLLKLSSSFISLPLTHN